MQGNTVTRKGKGSISLDNDSLCTAWPVSMFTLSLLNCGDHTLEQKSYSYRTLLWHNYESSRPQFNVRRNKET